MEEPPTKKAKMEEDFAKFIEDVMNSKNNLTAVIDDKYSEPIALTPMYAARIKDVKQLSWIVELLNKKMPLEKFKHLKRVDKNCVLLCYDGYFQNTDCMYYNIEEFLKIDYPELKDAFEYIKDIDVPVSAPLTKKQNNLCRFKWATNFHPSTHYEALLSDFVFQPKDLQQHRTYMAVALEISRIRIILDEPRIQDIIAYQPWGAIVVDPVINSIVAIALDNRRNHPSQHASMLAIDNVAKTQSGGAWIDGAWNYEGLLEKTVEITEMLKKKFPTVTFGCRKYVSKKEESDTSLINSPYLCTGYDIYLVREPCVMCAMALVHARVKRVFYMFDNKRLGGVHTKTKMHCVKGLNHRYEVFNGFDNV